MKKKVKKFKIKVSKLLFLFNFVLEKLYLTRKFANATNSQP